MSVWQSVVAWFTPQAKPVQVEDRKALAHEQSIQARYEGAGVGRRFDGWHTVGAGSANAEIYAGAVRLRDRSRDLVRNNWAASRAVSVIANNVVGAGIIPSSTSPGVESSLVAWADTTACDADGLLNLYGLQSAIMRTVVESGECLVLRERRPTSDGLPLLFQLRVLEGDYIDSLVDGPMQNGNRAIQGIEFDSRGKRVAYHLFESHPGDQLWTGLRTSSRRVPATEVIHVYRPDRPGQVRGVPWLSPVILKLRDFDEYEDAQLLRQKIAACYTAFVRRPDVGVPVDAGMLGEKVEPGMIEMLAPGEEVTFGSPPGVDGYADYSRITLREIASGIGLTYEALTGDLSQVNFSSARMGWLEFQRSIDHWREHILRPMFLDRVAGWILDSAELQGFAAQGDVIRWTAPRREMINPVDEIKAAQDAIRAGLTSRAEEIRKLGRDPIEVYREIAEDNQEADRLGLVLDTDPRQDANRLPQQEPVNG
jgi:lambda family phage portal protein